MLSFIFPPLIIILALVGLFFLLSRRAAQEQLAISSSEHDLPHIIREGKWRQRMRTLVRFPVYAARWFFQKIAAVFMRWKKQEKAVPLRMADLPSLSPSGEGEENITRVPEITIHSRRTLIRSRAKDTAVIRRETQLTQHPMVTESVTQPESLQQKRDLLEEELINRIATHPQDIEAYERLGDHYAAQDEADDAMECFKQVLKLSPGHHRARLMLQKLGKKNF